jgi:protocatechuate 3,4-dioxygenase, beta subunit
MEASPGVFTRRPTPENPQGPFYPLSKPEGANNDLTGVPGKLGKAQGQVIQVAGRVLDTNGKPLRDVLVEIWHANNLGRYTHPHDTNPASLDPNFMGYGVVSTDAEGRYSFKTIKPGAYKISDRAQRTRHIHFALTSAHSRLITQMHFEGEPLNEMDPIFPHTENKEDLLVKLIPLPDAGQILGGVWDIVLWEG